jgi:antitoxin PrlF
MFTSKITSKGQVTIPKSVRQVLQADVGDVIVYEIDGNTVTVRKARPFDAEWHDSLSTQLEEWNSPANDEAWNDL